MRRPLTNRLRACGSSSAGVLLTISWRKSDGSASHQMLERPQVMRHAGHDLLFGQPLGQRDLDRAIEGQAPRCTLINVRTVACIAKLQPSTVRRKRLRVTSIFLASEISSAPGEQRNLGHLRQIHPHRIVAQLGQFARRQRPTATAIRLRRGIDASRIRRPARADDCRLRFGSFVDQLDAHFFQGNQQIVELFRSDCLVGQIFVDLIVGQISLGLPVATSSCRSLWSLSWIGPGNVLSSFPPVNFLPRKSGALNGHRRWSASQGLVPISFSTNRQRHPTLPWARKCLAGFLPAAGSSKQGQLSSSGSWPALRRAVWARISSAARRRRKLVQHVLQPDVELDWPFRRAFSSSSTSRFLTCGSSNSNNSRAKSTATPVAVPVNAPLDTCRAKRASNRLDDRFWPTTNIAAGNCSTISSTSRSAAPAVARGASRAAGGGTVRLLLARPWPYRATR